MFTDIKEENSGAIDFNEEFKSFGEMFYDTELIPHSRYRLVENTEKANSGYCNGILNEYEIEVLRKELSVIDPESISKSLELSVNKESVYRKNIENLNLKTEPIQRLILSIGDKTFRGVPGEDFPLEKDYQNLFLTMMKVIKRRVQNTTFIEFRIV